MWLAFFRWAQCPLCNFRIHELVSVWADKFARERMVMLAVFQSPAEKLAGLTERHRPPFRVIPDPEMQLYELYGLGTSAAGLMGADVRRSLAGARAAGLPLVSMWDGPPLRTPADFLIDESGVIRVAYQGKNIADHIPFEAVTRFLGGRRESARSDHSSTS